MILAIETSAEPASVALLTSSGEILSKSFPNHNKVNTLLADQLADLLDQHDIQTILVGAGPGSYSGARVGLATAEAIALVHNAEVILIPSIKGVEDNARILIGDARQGTYFLQHPSDNTPKVMTKDELIPYLQRITEENTFMTFEDVQKLKALPLDLSKIVVTPSTAAQLIALWNDLTHVKKNLLRTNEQKIIYLKPPNITQPKNPFA